MSEPSAPGSLALHLTTQPLPKTAVLSRSACHRPHSSTSSYGSYAPAPGSSCSQFWTLWKPSNSQGEILLQTTEQISLPLKSAAYIAHIFLVKDRETVTWVTHLSARGHGHLLTAVASRPPLKFIFCKRQLPAMTIP